MYRFNMFTTKANEALNSAIKLAQNYGHNYVGTEHILLGLLTEGSVENALNNEGVTLDKIDELIKNEIGVGNPTRLTPDDFTPRAKRIIELSFQIARAMRHSYVGCEHLLIALLKEDDSYAVKFIGDCGASASTVLENLANELSSNDSNVEYQSPNSKKKSKSKTPTLDEFGKDLTDISKQGKIDRVSGREKEIRRVVQ
ncbi:Clp protease N-terminal domain-containing protein, partial [Eubacterium sp.]|uniref:Clp protease N-terminal domain-containing protein n=1 Tax=Eubacterium sp. TaxID=142586 RepID=UPI004025E0A1